MPKAAVVCPVGAGWLAMGVGSVVLVGWALDLAALKSILPGWVSVKPNTALAFILIGFALQASSTLDPRPTALPSRLARFCGWLGGLIGLLTLCEYTLGLNLGIDQWLFPEPSGTVGTSHPGRMAPDTALCFLLLAVGLEVARAPGRRKRTLLALALLGSIVTTVALAAILAYFTSSLRTRGWWGLTMMAIPTATVFAILGAALALVAWQKSSPVPQGSATTTLAPERQAGFAFLLVFLLLASGIIALGLFSCRQFERQRRAEMEQQLSAVADLKVAQIANWMRERRGDAEIAFHMRAARQFLAEPENAIVCGELLQWMIVCHRVYGYSTMALFDARGTVRLVVPTNAPLPDPHTPEQMRAALRAREAVMTDLHRGGPDQPIHMSLWVPIGIKPQADQPAEGVLLFVVDPNKFLFPLIQTWPTPSPTAETLLVRREGNEVLFLNELRHRKGTAMNLRRSLDEARLPAAMAARGESRVQDGVDYRGVRVVAAMRAVPDTEWVMVAKVDEAELLAPLRQLALAVVVVALALLLASALGVTVLWRRRSEHFLQAQLASERELARVGRDWQATFDAANDAVWTLDNQHRVLRSNRTAERFFQRPCSEMIGLPCWTIVHGTSQPLPECPVLRARNSLQRETMELPMAGRVFEVRVDPILDAGGQYAGAVHIVSDITQRKQHEAEIERLNRLYATLSQVNQTIVRTQTRETLFADICRVAVEFGQFKSAWIGWKAEDGNALTTMAHQASAAHPNLTMPGWQRGCGVMAEAVVTGRACLCNDASTDTRAACCRETLAGLGVQSCAAFPLRLRGEVSGVFSICSIDPSFFNGDEIRLLDEVTADISFAVDKLDEEEQRQRAEAALATQARIAAVFSLVSDDEVFNEVLKVVLDVLHSPLGVFGHLDEAGTLVVPTMTRQVWDKCQIPEKTIRFPRETWGNSSWPTCIRERRTVSSNEPSAIIPQGHFGIQRHISVPILFQGEPIGLFQVANSPSDYLDTDLRTLEGIAEYVAPLLNARLRRERAEAALHKNEAQLTFALEISHTGSWELDLRDHTARRTLIHDHIFGYEALLPRWTYEMFLEHVLPEDRAEVDKKFREATAAQADWNFECRIRRLDGQVRWIWAAGGHEFNEGGKPTRLAGIVQDITERMQTERERALLTHTLAASVNEIYLFDADTWRFRFVSEGARKNLGYTLAQLQQMTPLDLKPKFDRAAFERIAGPLLRREQPLQFFETVHRRADGSLYPVEVRLQLFEYQGDHVFLAVIVDVTERKRLEQERQVMETQLRQQQKLESIGTLASGVAHEINNPITGIMNYAQLIQDRLPGHSPLTEFTGEIMHESRRVAGIVRNLLTFARNEKQSHSPARIADIIEGTLSLIRTVIRHDQITLTVNVPEDLPQLKCRSQQIQQVIMNLMTNARDALNERYPGHDPDKVLKLDVRPFEKEGRRWIRVMVEDHGTGITPEVRERMFDPFFTTKPRDKGTGLGLAISHGIVKEHHGELTVESEPGKFTRMHLELPVENGWNL